MSKNNAIEKNITIVDGGPPWRPGSPYPIDIAIDPTPVVQPWPMVHAVYPGDGGCVVCGVEQQYGDIPLIMGDWWGGMTMQYCLRCARRLERIARQYAMERRVRSWRRLPECASCQARVVGQVRIVWLVWSSRREGEQVEYDVSLCHQCCLTLVRQSIAMIEEWCVEFHRRCPLQRVTAEAYQQQVRAASQLRLLAGGSQHGRTDADL